VPSGLCPDGKRIFFWMITSTKSKSIIFALSLVLPHEGGGDLLDTPRCGQRPSLEVTLEIQIVKNH